MSYHHTVLLFEKLALWIDSFVDASQIIGVKTHTYRFDSESEQYSYFWLYHVGSKRMISLLLEINPMIYSLSFYNILPYNWICCKFSLGVPLMADAFQTQLLIINSSTAGYTTGDLTKHIDHQTISLSRMNRMADLDAKWFFAENL